jgi:hypothetical protein
MSNTDLSKKSWWALSPQEKKDRYLVIEVLRRLRNGEKFSQVIEDTGISPALVRKHAHPYIEECDLCG